MRLTLGAQAQMYRQLSALAGAGLSPGASITALLRGPCGWHMRRCLKRVASEVWLGGKISESLAGRSGLVPAFHSTVLSVGEATGRADDSYRSLAAIVEHNWALQRRLKGELLFPKITLACALPFVIGIVFGSRQLSILALAAILCVSLFALILAVEYLLIRINGGSSAHLDGFILKLPVIGTAAAYIAQSHFARSFAALYSAGIEVSPALRSAAKASGSAVLTRRVMQAIPPIERGQSLTEALVETDALPEFASTMLSTGEQTGGIDSIMEYVANFYDEETADLMHRICITLGVAALLVVGVLVGILYIGGYS